MLTELYINHSASRRIKPVLTCMRSTEKVDVLLDFLDILHFLQLFALFQPMEKWVSCLLDYLLNEKYVFIIICIHGMFWILAKLYISSFRILWETINERERKINRMTRFLPSAKVSEYSFYCRSVWMVNIMQTCLFHFKLTCYKRPCSTFVCRKQIPIYIF